MQGQTLYDKLWSSHLVAALEDDEWLIYVDRHLLYEVTSPQAFEGLRREGRKVRRPDLTLALADHNVPTVNRAAGLDGIADPEGRLQVETLEANAAEFGLNYIPLTSPHHGIVHVTAPALGLTLPGTVIVCGDSHTSTHGAFGALAFGIGTSEAEHVLATQTIIQRKSRTMLVSVNGDLPAGVHAKDIVLALIGQIGTAGATGHVIEFAGSTIDALDMAGRMTICNMAIEAGARTGLIAPDETTFAFLRGTPNAPAGAAWDEAVNRWRALPSDPDAKYDRQIELDASSLAPMVTWGTSPEAVLPITGTVPHPSSEENPVRRSTIEAMLRYMDLTPGTPLDGLPIDAVFIGSCTNSRIEDLRVAARIASMGSVPAHVRALVVPGSAQVKAQAEAEGLHLVLQRAGFEWRDAGCSMCLGLNPDRLRPGERCASTSNRNFEGRQGTGGRTHLVSPAMAAAAAIHGRLVDIRTIL